MSSRTPSSHTMSVLLCLRKKCYNDLHQRCRHLPRWFSGIIRPSGYLTQEFTSLSMGEVPRSIRGWGLFAVLLIYPASLYLKR